MKATRFTREQLTTMSITDLNQHLKAVSSQKCICKKRMAVVDYNSPELQEITSYYDLVKDVKNALLNKPKTYFEFTTDDIDALDLEGLIRFKKGIQSKKCIDGGWKNEEVDAKCKELLDYATEVIKQKQLDKEESVVAKTELRTLLENYESHKDVNLLLIALSELAE